MRLIAVCTGTPKPIAAKSGLTGHFKTAVPRARITTEGVENDAIVDRANHGGPEQAVYLFGEADRLWWQAELGIPLPPGFFGENLLIDGLDSASLCLGDTLTLGAVRLQITAPRIPCVTFAARIKDPKGVDRFFNAARPGAYARVLSPGTVFTDDPVVQTGFDGTRITLAENLAAVRKGFKDQHFLERLLTVPAHAEGHRIAQDRLGRSQQGQT